MVHPPPLALSLVVPAYCEAHRLPGTLAALERHVGSAAGGVEVLVVVEQGTDGTLGLAREWAAQHPAYTVIDSGVQRGKGHAVRAGMRQARGELVFFMDADLSVPLSEIEVFRAYFAAHPEVDVLIGDRQHPRSDIQRRQTFLREHMGQAFNVLLRTLTGLRWRDTQCGFKAFRQRAAREIFERQEIVGFAFDVEVLLRAEALGRRVASHPVTWINSPASKVRIVTDSLRMLRDVWRVRRLLRDEAQARVSIPA